MDNAGFPSTRRTVLSAASSTLKARILFFVAAAIALLSGPRPALAQQGQSAARKLVAKETILAREDFADHGRNWDEADTETLTLRIDSGRYLFTRNEVEGKASTWNRFTVDPDSPFFFECSLSKLSEGDDGAYGLLWGFDKPDNSLVFMLSPRGYYLYGKWANGSLTRLIDWTPSNLVNRDGRRNLVAVKRYRERFEFFVNGQLVAEAPFEPPRGGNVGFQLWKKASVAIDYLTVGRYELSFEPPLEETDYQIPGPEAMAAGALELRLPSERAYLFGYRYAAEHFGLTAERLQKNRSYRKAAAAYQSAIGTEEQTAAPSRERMMSWNGGAGISFSRLGDLEQARTHHARALELARGLGGKPEISLYLGNLAFTLKQMNRPAEALTLYRESLALEQELNHAVKAAERLLSVGETYAALKRPGEALDSYHQACLRFEEAGDQKGLCGALLSYGETLAALNRSDNAAEQFRRAQALARELKQSSLEAKAWVRLGRLELAAGRETEARRLFQQAVRPGSIAGKATLVEAYRELLIMERRGGKSTEVARLLFDLGYVHINFDEYAPARPCLEEALELYRQLGDRASLAVILGDLASIERYEGRPERAVPLYVEAVDLLKATRNVSNMAIVERNLARAYTECSQPDLALEHFTRALALDEELGNQAEQADDHSAIGDNLYGRSRFAEAAEHAQKALSLDDRLKRRPQLLEDLNLLARIKKEQADYAPALDLSRRALSLAEELGDARRIAAANSRLASVYKEQGRFDWAMECYQKAMVIGQELDDAQLVDDVSFSMAQVWKEWGRYEKAIEIYRQSLSLAQAEGDREGMGYCLESIAVVYDHWGQKEEALAYLLHSLAVAEEVGKKEPVANRSMNVGAMYRKQGKYDQALEYVQKALSIYELLGKRDGMADCLAWIGSIHRARGDYEQALKSVNQALKTHESLQARPAVADDLRDLGVTYNKMKRYAEADRVLQRALDLTEELRRTARGSLRRDYLDAQIGVYEWLTATRLRDGKPESALETVERSASKYLVEQMSERLGDQGFAFSGIAQYQEQLPADAAVVMYANGDWPEVVRIVVERQRVSASLRDTALLDALADRNLKRFMDGSSERLRGLKIQVPTEEKAEEPGSATLERLVAYYRLLLCLPQPNEEERKARDQLSYLLCTFLLGNLDAELKDKKILIVRPDRSLGLLPFETLRMPDGRALIERFDVRYIQSLTVSEMLARRAYPSARQPLLALGGALYETGTGSRPTADSGATSLVSRSLIRQALDTLDRGENTRSAYESLGIVQWPDLPGSLREVRSLQKLVPAAKILTGAEVNEGALKKMSATGELAAYRVLHFATHGLVVPEIPELSALVLSQDGAGGREDGYLTMKEISALNLKADFVNLSACETALGRIYGGEGVVGLTQAFLVAGANGLSVSLWKVSDEATAAFMTGLYRLVGEKNLTYDRAICEMKRRFLSGQAGPWQEPFYWAPFVYYGR